MVAPPFTVKNNYLNSANAHIATAVLSNGADEHSLAEISLWRMNEISRRATQANMQFGMVPSSTASKQQQDGSQAQESAAAGATTKTTGIPMTEPKPVLVGMSREVALQRLQDLARVSSSDLTGVTGPKPGGLRSHPPPSPTRAKREEGGDDDEGGSDGESSTDGESDDEGGPRVYASQHAQRIPTGAGLKARNFTAYSAANASPPSASAPNPPTPTTLMPMPRGAGGTFAQGDNHRGLSVLTVGHLVPRPFSASGMSMSATGNGAGGPPSAGGPGTGVGPAGGWPIVMHNGASGPVPGVPGVGLGVNIPIDPMYRIPSPPAASPPSLSATDRRPLVHVYPPPTSPPPSLSPSVPSSTAHRGGGGSPSSPKQPKLRVRRSTYVPGWAVPPRVLLVEDDLVSRRLSSKFLQVSGCEIGVAVDGIGAVSKMELEKYDLVLMVRLHEFFMAHGTLMYITFSRSFQDIVIPKLDGISATNMIRRFDPMTPIISMTSNSKPSEILTYYSSGKPLGSVCSCGAMF
jgi:osomolarity two-component system response regulator SKN7